MKKSDADKIKDASGNELAKKAQELRKKIAGESMKRRTTQVKNVREIKMLKNQLAKVLTAKRNKELSGK